MIETFPVLCAVHSGSSMIAGAMHKMGVDMTKKATKTDSWHPRGTFERHDFMVLNNKILKQIDGSWNNPPDEEKLITVGFGDEIKKLLEDHQKPKWGWKCPRNCLTIPVWHPHLENPKYIVLRREMKHMISSWTRSEYKSKFGDISKTDAESTIRESYRRIDEFLKYKPRANWASFQYEIMLEYPERELKRLARFCGVEVTESALEMVDKQLRHF